MINLLPISKVISGVAVSYGVLVSIILWCTFDSSTSLMTSIGVALGGATVLNLLFVGLFFIGWKWLWSKFPILNELLFPDLSGEWEMKIHWSGGGETGIAKGVAHIKQNFIKISMEVETDKSESETLYAIPSKDSASGRAILYYIYRVIPRQVNGNCSSSYNGSAILKLNHEGLNSLKGNYFTSQQTKGFFELSRKAC